jgi:hypothetical protein
MLGSMLGVAFTVEGGPEELAGGVEVALAPLPAVVLDPRGTNVELELSDVVEVDEMALWSLATRPMAKPPIRPSATSNTMTPTIALRRADE